MISYFIAEIELELTLIREDFNSAAQKYTILQQVRVCGWIFSFLFFYWIFAQFLDDLEDLGEIGRGGFGTVNKMIFKKNNKVMAVKRIRCSNVVDEKEQKRIMVRIFIIN
jgi:hypothetical protein